MVSVTALNALQSSLAASPMATMTFPNIDDKLKFLLRVRAAQHGQSMEEEARLILQAALGERTQANTGAAQVSAIRAREERLDGVELELPAPTPMREPPDFGS
jgi:plasmid stability protein